jgi:hypothetical protein
VTGGLLRHHCAASVSKFAVSADFAANNDQALIAQDLSK